MRFWLKIFIALLLGVVVGHYLGASIAYIKLFGRMFIGMLEMIIVPLIFAFVVVETAQAENPLNLGKNAFEAIFFFFLTTIIAIGVALFFTKAFHLGVYFNPVGKVSANLASGNDFFVILHSLVPKNPVASFVEGNVIQIIVFSFFLGLAINSMGEKALPVLRVSLSLNEVMNQIVTLVVKFSPYGLFALMATIVSEYGFYIFVPLLKFLVVFYSATLFHAVVVFSFFLFLFKLSLFPFYRGMKEAIVVAFSTSSSKDTLPYTMHCVQQNLGVSNTLSRYAISLGANINMDGTAIFLTVCVGFLLQAYGIPLDASKMLTITVAAYICALATPTIQGSSYVMLAVVLSSVGLPLESIAFVAVVAKICVMSATALNILGDALCTVLVARINGEIDLAQYEGNAMKELELSTT